MKILLIAENWPPRVGGIERYLSGLAKAMSRKQNVEITVIAPPGSQEIDSANVRVISKRFFWPLIRPAWLPLYFFIKKLHKQEAFDVILSGKALFEGLLAHKLKQKLDIPYVVFTYAMEINTWLGIPRTKKRLLTVLSNAMRIVTINKSMTAAISALGIAEEKISTIYPSIDETFLKSIQNESSNSDVLQKYNIHKPFILTVCRLIDRKGVDDVIRAYAKLDQTKFADVQLVIAGEGPARSTLERVAAQEYIKPIFIGAAPDSDVVALFQEAEMFVLTPKEIDGDIEGFGIVYLEAAAADLPIIASRSGGVPEAIEVAGSGRLVEPGDVDGICKAITIQLEQPNKSSEKPHKIPTWDDRANQLLKLLS